MIRLRLELNESSREYAFHRSKICIGRSPMNDLAIPVEGVSARHGTLHVTAGGEIVFTDLDSVGGSTLFRSGEQSTVDNAVTVSEGDSIRLANAVSLIVLASNESRTKISHRSLPTTPVGALGAVFAAKLAHFALLQARRRQVKTFLAEVTHLVEDTLGVQVTATRMLRRGDGSQPERLVELDDFGELRGADASAGFHDACRNELLKLIQLGGLVHHSLDHGGTRLIVSGAEADRPGAQALVLDVALDDLSNDDLDDFAGLFAQLAPFIDGLGDEARRSRAEAHLRAENSYFRGRQRRHYLFKELVAESEAMRGCYARLNDFVETNEPVLIHGEAGTGKELIARAIHHLGARSTALMVAQNCHELEESLLDAELFGATGSGRETRLGILELANGGTVYLGEVDRLSPLLQGKLLRVIKEGEIRRHGEELARAVNVRLVLSTHRTLADLVKAGVFRRDLLTAIESVLEVPALRHRRGDIIPLTELFISIFAKRYDVAAQELSPSIAELLRNHEWRGNVRELQAVVEAAVLKSAGRDFRPEDFGF